MKLVYSFWSAPLKNRWKQADNRLEDFEQSTLRCMLLSILYAKKWGFRVEVVTDLEGQKLLQGMPYDKLTTELEFLSYNGKTWVEGKIMAISIQKEPFIHIDWDVFLLKHKVVEIFKTFKADLLVQSVDDKNYFAPNFMEEVAEMSHMLKASDNDVPHYHKQHDKQFNCGVMGFRNLKLRDEFVQDFAKALRATSQTHKDFSIHIEQGMLFSTVADGEYSYRAVINSKRIGEAEKIGYTHLLYLSKYTKESQDKIKQRIAKEFPDYVNFIREKPLQVIQTLNFAPMYRDDITPEYIKRVQRTYALSFAYLQQQGVEVRLYADPIGNKILRNIPYHNRTVTNKIYNDRFWATIKFDALKEFPEAIHVDGDVFIKDKSILEYEGDFICQHKETGSIFHAAYDVQIITMEPLLREHQKLKYAFNCGVLGFKNKSFFNEYLEKAKDLMERFENNEPIKKTYATDILGAQPMLIIEQYLLSLMTVQGKVKPHFIIKSKDYKSYEKVYDYSWGQGAWIDGEKYTHLMGPFKYYDKMAVKIKKLLQAVSPDLSKIINQS